MHHSSISSSRIVTFHPPRRLQGHPASREDTRRPTRRAWSKSNTARRGPWSGTLPHGKQVPLPPGRRFLFPPECHAHSLLVISETSSGDPDPDSEEHQPQREIPSGPKRVGEFRKTKWFNLLSLFHSESRFLFPPECRARNMLYYNRDPFGDSSSTRHLTMSTLTASAQFPSS